MTEARSYLVAGDWRSSTETFAVKSPFDGAVVAEICKPTPDDVEAAVSAAAQAFVETRKLPVHQRAAALTHISRRLEERQAEVAELIAREGGKPLQWAKVEASRAVATFRWAAEECRRETGEILRLDTEASLGSRLGLVRRWPLGPVLGITPFNFPVNLVAHKLAPALAVGAPIVIKPATKTPLGSLLLGELFTETDLPPGMLSVLPVDNKVAEQLVADERFKKLTFTGSTEVGWKLRGKDPKKAVTLELGGNAGVIVHSDADLEKAAKRVAFGGYYQAGQSCIAVQRVLVHESVSDAFSGLLAKEIGGLKVGDPLDPETDVGPLIDHDALERVTAWVDEAVQAGAEVLVGGKREDPFYLPTVLTRTAPDMKVRCEEVFGPVVTLGTYTRFEDAVAEVNNSRYGLQAGVFTRDVNLLMQAHRDIEVGGVIANDVSAFRADQMPYGGTKDSGVGREGLRSAMNEMTEPKILVLSDIPL
ncbi:MAG TPA: aldehyde dehydrogenase family protein [Actinomycetota bacterium]|nr:aldehyde dehydrogenase family protein [Actinomycetota bacterium]